MAAPATTTAPTTAERIRSTCARAGGAMLAIEGVEPIASAVHHLLDDGSVAITVPVDGLVAGMVVAAGAAVFAGARDDRLLAAPASGAGAIAGVDPWPGAGRRAYRDTRTSRPDRRCGPQSSTAASEYRRRRRRRPPADPGVARGRVGRRRRLDRSGGRRCRHIAAGATRSVLRDGVVLASASRGGTPRRHRPVGRPAADDSAKGTCPSARA